MGLGKIKHHCMTFKIFQKVNSGYAEFSVMNNDVGEKVKKRRV